MTKSFVESKPLGDPERGLAAGAPADVLSFGKPVGFPHETQNLASWESSVPQYRQVAN